MGLADVRALRERTVEARLDEELLPRIAAELDARTIRIEQAHSRCELERERPKQPQRALVLVEPRIVEPEPPRDA